MKWQTLSSISCAGSHDFIPTSQSTAYSDGFVQLTPTKFKLNSWIANLISLADFEKKPPLRPMHVLYERTLMFIDLYIGTGTYQNLKKLIKFITY